MTRSAGKSEALRLDGAQPVVADALDASAVNDAVVGARPDVVVHQLTAIPARLNIRRIDRDFALTNRLRTEGTDHSSPPHGRPAHVASSSRASPDGPTRARADR